MKVMGNKRGQEMSVSTIIILVLALIVLVVLALGFYYGWDNVSSTLKNLGGGKAASLDSVVQACNLAASSGSQNSFCKDFKKVSIDGKDMYVNCMDRHVLSQLESKMNCASEEVLEASFCRALRDGKSKGDLKLPINTDNNCNTLLEKYKTCKDLGGEWSNGASQGQCSDGKTKIELSQITDSEDKVNRNNMVCCK